MNENQKREILKKGFYLGTFKLDPFQPILTILFQNFHLLLSLTVIQQDLLRALLLQKNPAESAQEQDQEQCP